MRQRLTLMLGLLLCLALTGCGEPAPAPAEGPTSAPESDAAQQSPATEPAAAPASAGVTSVDGLPLDASNVTFYYEDLPAAERFYRETLGLRVLADYGTAKVLQVAPKAFLTLADVAASPEHAGAPKTTAIALVTDQLDEWWAYIETTDVPLRSSGYDPVPGRAHHGFVAIDPEGYLLEFERFNPHEENTRFMPLLDATATTFVAPGIDGEREGLGFKATIVWFYYRDMDAIRAFYEDVVGLEEIVDQGWTWIYRIGPAGYLGLVDESRGMHRYTDDKAVTLAIVTDGVDAWFEHFVTDDVSIPGTDIAEDAHHRGFLIMDPGRYLVGFGAFSGAPVNALLRQAIDAP